MDNTIAPPPAVRSDVVGVPTAPRPTPRPVGPPFDEVLARGARVLVRGATAAARTLPGSPLMAVALREGFSPALGPGPIGASPIGPVAGGSLLGPTFPVGAPIDSTGLSPVGVAGDPNAAGGDAGIGSALAQSQEMNLYYLQIQEQVNEQNRTFSTLSNVLEVEHNTAKTAIGNIH